MRFRDRVDAGRHLAEVVQRADLGDGDVVVLGLPRGGVPVAFEVAQALGAPLDVIVVRKLGVPFQPELAMGAIGEEGVRVVNEEVLRSSALDMDDFGGGDETVLTQQFDRPVMVDRYPMAIKAFYMAPDPERPEVALGVDVLAPEGYGEIIGGGQRIHDVDLLLRRIAEQNLPAEAFDWYIDLRKYGSVPHGGFGMGIERCVAWLCGLEHIRETIAFPRMLYRLKP